MTKINRIFHSKLFGVWAVLVGSIILTVFLYNDLIANAGALTYGLSGDSIKNYFTLAYYVRYDHGNLFTGMNYPYGEVVTYTDNQPLLAWILRWCHQYVDLSNHLIAIQNHLLIWSPSVGAIFMYSIIRKWGVGQWLSIVGAVCIAFLSPQVARFGGHFGMAYVWIIPIGWYIYLKLQDQKKTGLWASLLTAYVVMVGLLHPYNAVIVSLMSGALAIVSWIRTRDTRLWIISTGATLIGILVFLIIQSSIDNQIDRPKLPWGEDTYVAKIKGYLYPQFMPVKGVFDFFSSDAEYSNFESWMYLGLIPILVLIAAFCRLIIRCRLLWKRKRMPGINTHWRNHWWAALLIILLATGIFHDLGLRKLSEFITPIAQFRAPARFGWIVYYFIGVYALYFLHFVSKSISFRGMHAYGYFFGFLLGFYWVSEAAMYHKHIYFHGIHRDDIFYHSNTQFSHFLEEHNISIGDYQASIVLPHVIVGSEGIDRGAGAWFLREGFEIAYHHRLPLVSVYMSRLSADHALSLLELLNPEFMGKRRAADFTDQPFLVLADEYENLSPAEKKIIDAATLKGKYRNTYVYHLPAAFFKKLTIPSDWIQNEADSLSASLSLTFDDDSEPQALRGAGAFRVKEAKNDELMGTLQLTPIVDRSILYEASIWQHFNPALRGMSHCKISFELSDQTSSETIWLTTENEPIVDGQWVRYKATFMIPEDAMALKIYASGKGHLLDEFLLTAADDNKIIKVGAEYRIKNIHFKDK